MRFLGATAVAMLAGGCFSKPEFVDARDSGPDDPDARRDGPPSGQCAWQGITGLLAYLPFDEGSGLVAADESNLGNVGDLSGASWTSGRISNAVSFAGNHFVSLRSPAMLDNIGALTVCAWIYLDSPPADAATIADKSSNGYVGGWNFYVELATGSRLGFLSNLGDSVYGSNSVATAQWAHACASWDGTPGVDGMKLYRDGNLDPRGGLGPDTMPQNTSDDLEDLVLGRATNSDLYNLRGKLDEFFLFDRVLSLEEIALLYACAP